MSDRPAFIHVENLVKTFVDGDEQIAVLRGLTLSIAESEVLAIVGESGAGKSTLLHLLGGLDSPTSGSVRFEGRDITALSAAQLDLFRSDEVGFVFQFHHLMAEFTALENVAIGGMIAGLARPVAEARARELLVSVGLEARLTHRPPKLSGGERQRVALARALVNEPRVVLADEPTGNLDRKTSEAVHDLIWDLRDRLRQTFVIVTHNPGLADRSDRTVELVDGRIAEGVSDVV
ncbi:ABC transporter ATP-binding protein [Candidatus Poribacteria bacterium]|jgi:lipoprotein-releasing system ATP-binding protein|nr:ABC transporter ATP-binding protein [Candidatus Poribacteria bacterium]MBT5536166.1 ABC transporter ATP-binding protein [Candidatus Poribacteria bacterium]MBT5713162.1 ABC transporter ATP-binding protein [Candidatus Poribacteria bacterium]MBT7809063.1 ABC transporter ATP-binding protein [Candidatus Poribacteria bacterium]